MRKLMLLLAILMIGYLYAKQITGKVIAVQDGDTITVLKGKISYRIRLDGIDCPEKSQPYGNRAKQFTSDMVFGKKVKIIFLSKDRYGRYLGVVHAPNGMILNHKLLKAGLAWHYKQYNKEKLLSEMERTARSNGVGLWADKNPIPPWEFRRKKK
ncbi:MAG: thermonuclease family protein [Candidatus Cloacimonadaceae bacterium]|nr:thermonuclease family protein [Candidatus Cloacimonadaceae bacterium]